jgi:hypothetical protein
MLMRVTTTGLLPLVVGDFRMTDGTRDTAFTSPSKSVVEDNALGLFCLGVPYKDRLPSALGLIDDPPGRQRTAENLGHRDVVSRGHLPQDLYDLLRHVYGDLLILAGQDGSDLPVTGRG